eukprot:TRINITY_DN21851_c0_g1_i1.p1 TRINITY_DN21851_c0_g1~~TRINITY_DN21851_c0_g1_i1.p1  ORF type:complete len:618 (-),score=286.12 TRINITY_DN21851_c0_g1_i1:40-1893(-)
MSRTQRSLYRALLRLAKSMEAPAMMAAAFKPRVFGPPLPHHMPRWLQRENMQRHLDGEDEEDAMLAEMFGGGGGSGSKGHSGSTASGSSSGSEAARSIELGVDDLEELGIDVDDFVDDVVGVKIVQVDRSDASSAAPATTNQSGSSARNPRGPQQPVSPPVTISTTESEFVDIRPPAANTGASLDAKMMQTPEDIEPMQDLSEPTIPSGLSRDELRDVMVSEMVQHVASQVFGKYSRVYHPQMRQADSLTQLVRDCFRNGDASLVPPHAAKYKATLTDSDRLDVGFAFLRELGAARGYATKLYAAADEGALKLDDPAQRLAEAPSSIDPAECAVRPEDVELISSLEQVAVGDVLLAHPLLCAPRDPFNQKAVLLTGRTFNGGWRGLMLNSVAPEHEWWALTAGHRYAPNEGDVPVMTGGPCEQYDWQLLWTTSAARENRGRVAVMEGTEEEKSQEERIAEILAEERDVENHGLEWYLSAGRTLSKRDDDSGDAVKWLERVSPQFASFINKNPRLHSDVDTPDAKGGQRRFALFNGEAQWRPDQLEGELEAGSWIGVRLSPSAMLQVSRLAPRDKLGLAGDVWYRSIMQALGPEYEAVSRFADADNQNMSNQSSTGEY